MEHILTDDGSPTIRNHNYEEFYHSISGGKDEAIRKFVMPALPDVVPKKLSILDIGFGLGYNIAAALDVISSLHPGTGIHVVSLEKDSSVLKAVQEIDAPFESYNIIQQAAHSQDYHSESVSIRLVMGDATETINTINEKFHMVFLDAFSPKRNPELWTESFLKDVATRMFKGAVLTTYSCASVVRKNLKKAGLTVTDGPCIGRRSPATIAFL